MVKLCLSVLGGVFVGALVLEMMRRKSPETYQKFTSRARKALARVAIPEECEQEFVPENA